MLTSNFWRAQLLSQFGRPLPNPRRLPTVWVVFILPNNLLLVRPESSVQHQEEKWLLQTTECSNGSTKSAIFTWTNFTNCRFKFASFGNICIVCPVLFENWTTQRFTITKKLNILKQTVSKKIMTRPANNGCRKDSLVPHAIIKRDFKGPPVTSQERWRHSRWRMFRIWKSFYKVKMDFWE